MVKKKTKKLSAVSDQRSGQKFVRPITLLEAICSRPMPILDHYLFLRGDLETEA